MVRTECVQVFHVVLFAMLLLAVVMSGDVGDWCMCGSQVGLSVLSMMCVDCCRRSAINVPLWSSVLECHVVEWALMSPDIIWLVSVSR